MKKPHYLVCNRSADIYRMAFDPIQATNIAKQMKEELNEDIFVKKYKYDSYDLKESYVTISAYPVKKGAKNGNGLE